MSIAQIHLFGSKQIGHSWAGDLPDDPHANSTYRMEHALIDYQGTFHIIPDKIYYSSLLWDIGNRKIERSMIIDDSFNNETYWANEKKVYELELLERLTDLMQLLGEVVIGEIILLRS